MRLANPELLLLGVFLPLFWLGARWWRRRTGQRSSGVFQFANFVSLSHAGRGLRARLASLPTILRLLALAALLIALARPQTEDEETLMGKGLDIMICLDMSGSMNAVDMDVEEIARYQSAGKEPPNRFQMAIEILKKFIRNRKGDRVGLVVFSSEAYLKFPLTLDYETALRQLNELVLDSMERRPGDDRCINDCTIKGEKTAIGDALAKAYKRLEKSDGIGKLIVLITDGNDNASKLKPLDVAKYIGELPDASRPGLYAFLVGGGPNSKIPLMYGGKRVKELGFLQYVPYDEQVDEQKIREMVEAAKGVFHVSYDEEEFREAFAGLESAEHMERKITWHKDHFLAFLLAGLVLLGLEFILHVTFLRRFP